MTTAVIAFTRRGTALGRSLADALGGTLHVPARFAPEVGAEAYSSLEGWTAWAWARADALVFVGAAGIAVRAIAPHVRDKFSDPAVVSVDEAGRFVVPLLSGHVGGANELARRVAALTGGQAAVSTATDVNGLFAVDVWARERGMAITDRVLAKEVSAALLEGRPVGFASDFGHPCPEGLTTGPSGAGGVDHRPDGGGALPPHPASGAPEPDSGHRLPPGDAGRPPLRRRRTPPWRASPPEAVAGVATIDLKKDESGLLAFCARRGLPLTTYSAEALAAVEGDFTPSAFVRGITGVTTCASGGGRRRRRIIVPKQANNGVTAAVARKDML